MSRRKRPTKEAFSRSVADCTASVEMLPDEPTPLAVTLERSIDFLRSQAAARLAAELDADPDTAPAPQPCIWCERPDIGLGYARYKTLCPPHAALGAEFVRRDGEYVTRLLKADCPQGFAAEGDELSAEYRERGRRIAQQAMEVAA